MQGPQGPKGDTGPQGPQGKPGEVEEAPTDGQQYARQEGRWEPITSGTVDYTALTNKPQVNGIELSGNKTTAQLGINIPTKTSDLTNDSNFSIVSETGKTIDFNYDASTYKLSAVLKDKNGNIISTSTEIDLPIEQLVVSITFDSQTNELVITLKNGNVTRVPLGSIISGLATQTWVQTNYQAKDSDAVEGNIAQFDDEGNTVDSGLGVEQVSTIDMVTSISASSTDSEVPTAKAVYDFGGGVSDYDDLTNKPKINNVELSGNKSASDLGLLTSADISGKQDIATLETDVASKGFTKNTGTVTKVTAGDGLSGGDITSTGTVSLSNETKASLAKADSAVQDSNYVHTDNNYTTNEKSKLSNLENYDDTNVQNRLSAIENQEAGWSSKYSKPSTGIPKSDLDSAVQVSLGKADTALQEHQDISGKMNLVSNPVSGNILVTDENGQAQNSECGISEVTSMAISTIINDSSSDDEIPTAEAVKEYVDEHGGGSAEKITSQIVGDGSTTEFSITHNLNNREVFVVVYDAQYNDVLCDIQRTSNNTVKVIFNEAPEVGSTYTVVIQTPGGAKGPKGDPGGVEEAPENNKQYARKNGE